MNLRNYYWQSVKRPQTLFLIYDTILRLVLIGISWPNISHSLKLVSVTLVVGLINDFAVSLIIIAPLIIWRSFKLSNKSDSHYNNQSKTKLLNKFYIFIFSSIIIFKNFSEVIFWQEFNCRFNFIAVDYLVYTHEVSKNIKESYNLPLIFSAIFVGAIMGTYFIGKWQQSFKN